MNREALAYLSREDLENMTLKYYKVISDLNDLIDNSEGVVGLHLNGNVATWDSLLSGGGFEEWLGSLSEVIKND